MATYMKKLAVLVLLVTAVACEAYAETAATPSPSLPGGATSLSETHQDWTVNCRVVSQSGKSRRACTLSQQQMDSKSRQRLLSIEIAPSHAGIRGLLVLPFGLALKPGVKVQIDTASTALPLSFRTCLPLGCLVDVAIDGKQLVAWRAGTALKVATVADGGQPTSFSISLKGFAEALDRTVELLK
jgi:invasion protein IalB